MLVIVVTLPKTATAGFASIKDASPILPVAENQDVVATLPRTASMRFAVLENASLSAKLTSTVAIARFARMEDVSPYRAVVAMLVIVVTLPKTATAGFASIKDASLILSVAENQAVAVTLPRTASMRSAGIIFARPLRVIL